MTTSSLFISCSPFPTFSLLTKHLNHSQHFHKEDNFPSALLCRNSVKSFNRWLEETNEWQYHLLKLSFRHQLLVYSVTQSYKCLSIILLFLQNEQDSIIIHTGDMVYCPVVHQWSCCLWKDEWEARSPEGWRKLRESAGWGSAPLLGQGSPLR